MATTQTTKTAGNAPDRQIVNEQNKEFKALADDLTMLKEAMNDMAEIVHESGETLNVAQKNTEEAKVETAAAKEELKAAEYHQNSARKKHFCNLL
ncbi:hypothetical protein Pelo_42 [Pelomyxa schiedti]|nr:hypothetical protein Pelo_42 [Pelomyxa schiedti]